MYFIIELLEIINGSIIPNNYYNYTLPNKNLCIVNVIYNMF